MSVINTNINTQVGLNNLRVTNLQISGALEKLSSGFRINKAADDPSGLAIATGMTAQIRGIRVAIGNAEDNINLIQTADGALKETDAILQRMRDLAVRASNEAPLTSADRTKLNNEFVTMRAELDRKAAAVTFNTKAIMNGSVTNLATAGLKAQIGPDNGAVYRMSVVIPSTQAAALGATAGALTGTNLTSVTTAQKSINIVNSAIEEIAATRSALGVLQRRLGHVINDLTAQDINISAARSRIQDTDFATEISNFTKLQILQQSGTAILAQANAQPQSVLQLLQ
jgi:flagellin